MSPNLYEVYKIKGTFQPMVEVEDLLSEAILLGELKNTSDSYILEIGAGNAGWPLSLYNMGVINPVWHLVEDFSWATKSDNSKEWETSEYALTSMVKRRAPDLKLADVKTTIPILPYDQKFDVIRIDCKLDFDYTNDLIQNNLADDGLLFIDDCKLNCGFERVALLFDLLENSKLNPVWFGTKECILSPSNMLGKQIINILNSVDNLPIKLYHREETLRTRNNFYHYVATTTFMMPGAIKFEE